MKFRDRLRAAYRAWTATTTQPTDWLKESLGGFETVSSITVDEQKALRIAAVYACARVLAESVASLPIHIYRRVGSGRVQDDSHPLNSTLREPNPEMTRFQFLEVMMLYAALWGNAYAQMVETADGLQLWPIAASRVTPERNTDTGNIRYRVNSWDGAKTQYLSPEQMLHVPALGFDGIVGYSPIRLMREGLGLTMAAEQFGAAFFANKAQIGTVLSLPDDKYSDEAQKKIMSALEKASKPSKAHKTLFIPADVKVQQFGIPPGDAQFLETRKFQINEIARIFRVPPHMIGDLERATFSNIEQQSIEFVTHTLRPWLVRFEQALNKKLLGNSDEYYVEFKVDGLLRGDTESRFRAYAIARQNGWMSANDIRRLENMNPIPSDQGGDEYLVQQNMMELGKPQPAPQPPQRADRKAAEVRSIDRRVRVTNMFVAQFEQLFNKTISREASEIAQAYKDHPAGFNAWLDEFYNDVRGRLERDSLPILRSLAIGIKGEIDDELGHAARDDNALPEDLNAYVLALAEGLALRHVSVSKYKIKELLAEPIGTGQTVEDRLSAMLQDWKENRAAGVAADETKRASNSIAENVYISRGVSAFKWVTRGSETCPFCNGMSDATRRVDESFLSKGAKYHPEGAAEPMEIKRELKRPPLHKGCDCTIAPVL